MDISWLEWRIGSLVLMADSLLGYGGFTNSLLVLHVVTCMLLLLKLAAYLFACVSVAHFALSLCVVVLHQVLLEWRTCRIQFCFSL